MGRDKTSADFLFDGEPLAARVARRLGEVCDEVVVASGDGARLGWLGLPQVADTVPGRGPLAGLIAGLESAGHFFVAVVAADMPFASPAVLRLLSSRADGFDAVLPVSDRGLEPLHAIYAREAAAPLAAALAAGTLAVRDALSGLRTRVVERSEWARADQSGRFAWNVNRPGDVHDP